MIEKHGVSFVTNDRAARTDSIAEQRAGRVAHSCRVAPSRNKKDNIFPARFCGILKAEHDVGA